MSSFLLSRAIRSVETSNGTDIFQGKLAAIGENAEVREYGLEYYLMLYAPNQ